MSEPVVSAMLGIIAGLLSGGLAGWFALRKVKKETENLIRKDLYTRQLDSYSKFWQIVLESSKYGRPDGIVSADHDTYSLNREIAEAFVSNVSAFHSSSQGIYLSNELAELSFRTIEIISNVLDNESTEANISIGKNKAKKIEGGLSLMKYHLRHDVNLRVAKPAKDLLGDSGA